MGWTFTFLMMNRFFFAGLRVCQYDLVGESGHTDQYWDGLKSVSMCGGAFGHEPSLHSLPYLYCAFSRAETPDAI